MKTTAHFIHVPKTGGTAVHHALEGHEEEGTYKIALQNHRFFLTEVKPDEKVFFFLRDPLTRFVSGFYSRQRQGRPRYNMPWKPEEAVAFGNFNTPDELGAALSSPDEARRAAAADAINSIGHTRFHYDRWFGDEAYFRSRIDAIIFIGFQESLNDDFVKMKDKLGLPQSLILPDDEISAHRNPATVDKRLGEEATRNLKQWFATDYAFMDLCHEIAAKLNA